MLGIQINSLKKQKQKLSIYLILGCHRKIPETLWLKQQKFKLILPPPLFFVFFLNIFIGV